MQQQIQQLHNRQHEQQRHDEQLQHQHEHCRCETNCDDSKHYLTSTQIGHRFIPPPILLANPTSAADKYLSDKLIEESNPRAKGLPFETTNKLYHDRKIIERDPSEYYNRENVVDCYRNPQNLLVHPEPERPFTSSEYADRYKSNKTVTFDVPTSRPDQCLDNLHTTLTDAGSQFLKDVDPASLDVMCDVTPSNQAVMKLLHPYISVYDFDFEYPGEDSPFIRYRKQILDSYSRNKELNIFTLKTPKAMYDPLSTYGNTTSFQPEQNLNNPHFGALQIVPKRAQHVPNFGLVSEARDMFVDPRKMLDRTYRRIALFGK